MRTEKIRCVNRGCLAREAACTVAGYRRITCLIGEKAGILM